MTIHRKLSQVLGEFASTLVTDFPIQAILDQLVERIVDVLPVDAAGVTLISPGLTPRYLAASDKNALRFEQLQSELKESPCLLAYSTGLPVTISDLHDDRKFSQFSARAVDAGLHAVFTFPLRHEDERLGALDLYRMTPGRLEADAMAGAEIFADVATAYLLNAKSRSELVESSDRAHHLAMHDSLTGLPNRALLIERLEHAIARNERSELSVAIFYADLDRFKAINDTYGHQMGDELLIAVGQRLTRLLRTGDTVARLSGDEFVILCEDFADPSQAHVLAERIQVALGTPFDVCGVDLNLSASVGVAFAGAGCDVPDRVLQDADSAMYLAKRKGGARTMTWDIRSYSAATFRTNLNHDLRGALERHEIFCDYQPIVCTSTGEVRGAEALVRWAHPSQGIIAPDTLIPLAEHSGLINEIGRWVLKQACEDRNRWPRGAGGDRFELSVNVSACELMSHGYAASVRNLLTETHTDPACITLEVTESVFVHDVRRLLSVLEDLKAVGVAVALDDFGTGYSSLSYLKQFPVDTVKIDKLFVADVDSDAESYLIVNAVIDLAHGLHLTAVAEGVETVAQFQHLASLGCDSCQGFLFARPVSAAAFAELLVSPMASGSVSAWRTHVADGAVVESAARPALIPFPVVTDL